MPETFKLEPAIIPTTIEDICGHDEPASTSFAIYRLYHRPQWYRAMTEHDEFLAAYEVGVTSYPGYDEVRIGNERSFVRDWIHVWRDLLDLLHRHGEYQCTETTVR